VVSRGFTYPTVLVLLAFVLAGSGLTARVTAQKVKREKEMELRYRGIAIQQAIKRYYESVSPKRYPDELSHLTKDPRLPHAQYLRKLYQDPFASGEADDGHWQLVPAPTGGVMGVASKSDQSTLRRSQLPEEILVQGTGEKYSDWQFIYIPVNKNTSIPETRFDP
jgi:hypothetical protein